MRNHSILLFPGWTNASDYRDTAKSFGTVALHSHQFDGAVAEAWRRIKTRELEVERENEGKDEGDCIKMDKDKLTRDQQYICKAMGTDLPFLPFYGEQENKLFARLILESPIDDEEMAVEWCKHVNGTNIFPKLPVHVRTHREEWEWNQRIKDAVQMAMAGIEKLNELNAVLVPPANDPLTPPVNETPIANATHGTPTSEAAAAADVPTLGQPLPFFLQAIGACQ